MTPFLKKQQKKLIEMRDRLLGDISDISRATPKLRDSQSQDPGDNGDMGSSSYQKELAFDLLANEQKELVEIDDALERIQAGKYGICELSGAKIPQKRLEYIPFARFTAECQEQQEKKKLGRLSSF